MNEHDLAELLRLKDAAVAKILEEIQTLNIEHQNRINALCATLERLDPAAARQVEQGMSSPAQNGTIPPAPEEIALASVKYNPKKYCPICELVGHDGRAHRGQYPQTRPYSRKELEVHGFCPPAVVV